MDEASLKEKRKFYRLSCHVPVEFTISHLQGDLPGIDWEKGHTRDVSQKGLGLQTDALSEATIRFLNKQNVFLELRIKHPKKKPYIRAVGEVRWHEKLSGRGRFLIGLRLHSIPPAELKLLLSGKQKKK